MTPVQQRVEIAKILGFRENVGRANFGMENRHRVITPDGRPYGCWEVCEGNSGPGGGPCAAGWKDYPLPDWPADLNACAEFEAWLNTGENDGKGLAAAYCENLEAVLERDSACWIEHLGASAKQRCEAFLRTFDAWEESDDDAKWFATCKRLAREERSR